MRKILKIVAIILVILALLLMLSQLVRYLGGPNMLGISWLQGTWLGSLSITAVVALSVVGLVIAAVLSPKGFSKAVDRVTSAVSVVGKSAGTMVTKVVGSTLSGVAKGLFSGFNWLWIGVAGLAAYALWPSADERSARARARIEEVAARREENALEEEISRANRAQAN